MIFEKNFFLRYISLTDQISLPDCLYLVFPCLNKVFKYYLYAGSYMLLHSSAYNLLLLCLLFYFVYVCLYFVEKYMYES